MDRQFNLSKSSRSVINFALLFFWVLLSIMAYMFLAILWALITGQAIWHRAIVVLIGLTYGLFLVFTGPLQTVNEYNRIRVAKEGLYVEVHIILRYLWKFVPWRDVLDLKLVPDLDRWRKPQWLIKVKELTYWHRWISWRHNCGSNPGILITSDLIDREELLNIIEENLHKR
ncbi:MAG: hypothetical protein JW730_08715 [Anaerolineales bacterium]|nr:hypothetical protein [Anaerolineales bacterium]